MSITFCENPIPVVTPLGAGYVIYVKSNGMLENDEWAIALEEGGDVRHFLSDQIQIFHNKTYNIQKDEEDISLDFSSNGGFCTFTNSTAEE